MTSVMAALLRLYASILFWYDIAFLSFQYLAGRFENRRFRINFFIILAPINYS